MKLKILSWNIWIEGDFDQVSDFLKTSNADIIGLQEVKDDDSKRNVIEYLNGLGYQHVFAPIKKTWGKEVYNDGPAIFSKYEILKTKSYILSKVDSRIAVKAEIQVKDKILHVFSTHLIHTHQQESKEQNEQVESLIKVLSDKQTIVMGDFNATPVSSVMRNMQKVLVDSDPSSFPTWSVYPEGCLICNPHEINTRLDYIFTSKDISVKSFKVENSKASDHLPVSVIIDL